MCATVSSEHLLDKGNLVSILCPKLAHNNDMVPGNLASLILISKIRHHELAYDGISASQHYFGFTNKFFNGLFR